MKISGNPFWIDAYNVESRRYLQSLLCMCESKPPKKYHHIITLLFIAACHHIKLKSKESSYKGDLDNIISNYYDYLSIIPEPEFKGVTNQQRKPLRYQKLDLSKGMLASHLHCTAAMAVSAKQHRLQGILRKLRKLSLHLCPEKSVDSFLNSEKRAPGWLGDTGDYTSQLYGDYNKPGSLLNNQYNGK